MRATSSNHGEGLGTRVMSVCLHDSLLDRPPGLLQTCLSLVQQPLADQHPKRVQHVCRNLLISVGVDRVLTVMVCRSAACSCLGSMYLASGALLRYRAM